VSSQYRYSLQDVYGKGEDVEKKVGITEYYTAKESVYREEKIEEDDSLWWANGNIICNELENDAFREEFWDEQKRSKKDNTPQPQIWGDHFLLTLRSCLETLCSERKKTLPSGSVEFFLNKRDYPQLKWHIGKGDGVDGKLVEPYGFLFGGDDRYESDDVNLNNFDNLSGMDRGRVKDCTMAPIVSFYAASPYSGELSGTEQESVPMPTKDGSLDIPRPDNDDDIALKHYKDHEENNAPLKTPPPPRFLDLPFPSSEDWEGATGLVYPNTLIHKQTPEGTPDFEKKKPRDLFTAKKFKEFETNSWENKVATAFFRGTATGGGVTIEQNQRLKLAYLSSELEKKLKGEDDVPLVDAKIVGWNLRDKKPAGSS